MSKKNNQREFTEQLLIEERDEVGVETAIWNLGRKASPNYKSKKKQNFLILSKWKNQAKPLKIDLSKKKLKKSKNLKKKEPFRVKTGSHPYLRYEVQPTYFDPKISIKDKKNKKKGNSSFTLRRKKITEEACRNEFNTFVMDLDILKEKKKKMSFKTKPLTKFAIKLKDYSRDDSSAHSSLKRKLKKITSWNKDLDLKFGKLHKMRLKYSSTERKSSPEKSSRMSFNCLKRQLMNTLRGKSNKSTRIAAYRSRRHTPNREREKDGGPSRMKKIQKSERVYENYSKMIYSRESQSKYAFKEIGKTARIFVKEGKGGVTERDYEPYGKNIFKKTVRKYIPKNRTKIQFNFNKIQNLLSSQINSCQIKNFSNAKNNIRKNFFNKNSSSRVMPNTASIKSLF